MSQFQSLSKIVGFLGAIFFGMVMYGPPAFSGTPKEIQFLGETTHKIDDDHQIRLTAKEMNERAAAAKKRVKRGLAQVSNFESVMSPQLKALRLKLLSIKDSKKLDDLLQELNRQYLEIEKAEGPASYFGKDRDFRFFAAQVLPLQCLKGITFRFTPLAEASRVVESRLVTAVDRIAHAIINYAPRREDLDTPEARQQSEQNQENNIAQSIFDYMTLPYENVVLFQSGYDLQAHLWNECHRQILQSAERIERLDLSQPIVLDRKMFFGVGTLPDDMDRYRLVGEGEKHLSLAAKHFIMHNLAFFRSYSIAEYFPMKTELARNFVSDAFPSFRLGGYQSIQGVNLKKNKETISGYKNTFLRFGDWKNFMIPAYEHLARTVQELNLAWIEVKDQNDNPFQVIDPGFFKGGRRNIEATLNQWLRLTEKGTETFVSRLTGRKVIFNLKAFYDNPPIDLKKFLPKDFDPAEPRFKDHPYKVFVRDEKSRKLVPAKSNYAKARNYMYETPINWDLDIYKLVFPELKNGADVPQKMRTLHHAWGGDVAAAILVPFMN